MVKVRLMKLPLPKELNSGPMKSSLRHCAEVVLVEGLPLDYLRDYLSTFGILGKEFRASGGSGPSSNAASDELSDA